MPRQAILNRTIFYDSSKNRYRLRDWALVNTSIGAGWEPISKVMVPDSDFTTSHAAIDLDDPISRIDKIEFGWEFSYPFYTDKDKGGNNLSPPLIGGILSVGLAGTYLPEDVNVQ